MVFVKSLGQYCGGFWWFGADLGYGALGVFAKHRQLNSGAATPCTPTMPVPDRKLYPLYGARGPARCSLPPR